MEIHYAVGLLQQRESTQQPDRKLLTSGTEKISESEPPPVYEVATEASQICRFRLIELTPLLGFVLPAHFDRRHFGRKHAND